MDQAKDFSFRKTLLDNGLRIVTEEIPHVRSVAVGFWVAAGSVHEQDSEAGASHLIEHMLFKGTSRFSARDIAETIEGMGGTMNAGTGREYTCLYARAMDEHFPRVVDILSDMMRNPAFKVDDLEREQRVVAEEIKMFEDSPDDLVHDLFVTALWPEHPISRSILGTAETVKNMTRESLRRYHGSHYSPARVVLAVAGNVDHQQVVEEASRCLGDWQGGGAETTVGSPLARPGRLVREKDIEQVHLCLGGPGPCLEEAELYPAMVLSSLLGGGTSSRLFQSIREESGLAYSVNSFQSAMKKAGLLGIYAATSPDTAVKALQLIFKEIEDLSSKGATAQEFSRAREHLKGSLTLTLEGTGARMSRLGRQELSLGRVESPDQLLHKLDSVTQEEVALSADRYLAPGRMALAAVGRVPKELTATFWEGEHKIDRE